MLLDPIWIPPTSYHSGRTGRSKSFAATLNLVMSQLESRIGNLKLNASRDSRSSRSRDLET